VNARNVESGLAWFTLGLLAVYAPLETWASLPEGLWRANYLVDVAAMALLLWGAVHSLRARPAPAAGVLCGAYGWATANGCRAAAARLAHAQATGQSHADLGAVTLAAAVSLACFVLSLLLVARASRRHDGQQAVT
jgi:hypothetical protein